MGPGIWVSKNVGTDTLFSQQAGNKLQRERKGKKEKKNANRNDAKAEAEPRLRVSFPPSAYSAQIAAPMTSLRPAPRDRRGWLPAPSGGLFQHHPNYISSPPRARRPVSDPAMHLGSSRSGQPGRLLFICNDYIYTYMF